MVLGIFIRDCPCQVGLGFRVQHDFLRHPQLKLIRDLSDIPWINWQAEAAGSTFLSVDPSRSGLQRGKPCN